MRNPCRRRLGVFVAAALLLALSHPAVAWNATGHEVVAELAWNDLKPAVRDRITALLKEHPLYAAQLVPNGAAPDAPDLPLRVFMRSATWPDMIRSGRAREYHHPEWHYVDNPILAEGMDRNAIEVPPLGDKIEPGKPPQNILQALEWATAKLKQPDAPAAEKAIAVCWIAHLVGDIHQPLHACEFFSPDYPKGDRGGNLWMVKYHGVVTNLHSFWDERLGGYMTWTLVDAVARKTAERNPRATLEKELTVTKWTDWAAESFTLARDTVYAGGKLKGVTRESSNANQGATTPELPEGYDQAANDAARLRVALAGYRLADLVNRLLSEDAAPAPAPAAVPGAAPGATTPAATPTGSTPAATPPRPGPSPAPPPPPPPPARAFPPSHRPDGPLRAHRRFQPIPRHPPPFSVTSATPPPENFSRKTPRWRLTREGITLKREHVRRIRCLAGPVQFGSQRPPSFPSVAAATET
jgi:hypothetical protein